MGRADGFAARLIAGLKARGTRHVFGVPGGGSSLDLIEACGLHDIPFVLTRGETAAVLMAAVSGELTGAPGAALTGVGPGAASALNGMAYAALERSPMVHFADRIEPTPARPTWHQVFDQPAAFAPVSRAARWIRPDTPPADVAALLDLTVSAPNGPLHLDIVAAEAGQPASALPDPQAAASAPVELPPRALDLIRGAERPVVIVGLQVRHAATAVRTFADALDAAVLTTYKAMGTVGDGEARTVGQFTGGTAEAAVLNAADLIVLAGHDPIEMIPGAWGYDAPVLAVSSWDWAAAGGIPVPDMMVVGDPGRVLDRLVAAIRADGGVPRRRAWQAEVARHRADYRARLTYPAVAGLAPDRVISAIQDRVAAMARLTVDAGAHMFPTLARWQAEAPLGVLKSNGLSTMGYAVPAAIASALVDTARPVVAVTGDGGMMMSLAELATARERGLDILIVVMNDAVLSLIDVKQQKQQRPRAGVAGQPVDFAALAAAFGLPAARVETMDGLAAALDRFDTVAGPRLLDVRIDPSGYGAMLDAMRG